MSCPSPKIFEREFGAIERHSGEREREKRENPLSQNTLKGERMN
jgi:hypothetical protein